uniref:Uncharacterized protein n=1 Tax=Rhizophora mucronata TaxID=61149 RepID=A0A2P2QC60_RHIMU
MADNTTLHFSSSPSILQLTSWCEVSIRSLHLYK